MIVIIKSTNLFADMEKRLNPKVMRTGRSIHESSGPQMENVEPFLEEEFPIPYSAYYDFPIPFYRF